MVFRCVIRFILDLSPQSPRHVIEVTPSNFDIHHRGIRPKQLRAVFKSSPLQDGSEGFSSILRITGGLAIDPRQGRKPECRKLAWPPGDSRQAHQLRQPLSAVFYCQQQARRTLPSIQLLQNPASFAGSYRLLHAWSFGRTCRLLAPAPENGQSSRVRAPNLFRPFAALLEIAVSSLAGTSPRASLRTVR